MPEMGGVCLKTSPRLHPWGLLWGECGTLHTVPPYKWFSWGVASLPEGKSRGLCLVQLCAKYRLVNAKLSPYH